jgi:hypothetical protein
MTVAEELLNRRDCRHRLSGVRVRHAGRDLLVLSSGWDARGDLRLTLVPDGHVDITYLRDSPRVRSALALGGIVVLSLGDFHPRRAPGEVPDVPADECILVGFWPVACCRPGRWNPHNSRNRARRAGVPMPAEIPHRHELVTEP